MNTIREIQRLNKLELENGVAPEASWHRDHADSAYIYIGGLPFDLSEGDIATIFSQFGEPTFVKLVRDKETGKSKGFAFLKYEDQRSTDLAVDNLGGATVMGRVLKVDHTKYQRRDDEEEEDGLQNGVGDEDAASDSGKGVETRPLLKEEKELAALLRDQDEDDPMKEYLIQEKREEVARAIAKLEKRERKGGEKRKHRHRHHHHHKHSPKRHRSPSESDREQRRHKHRAARDSDSSGGDDRRHRHRPDRRRSRSPR
ncbi:MAG: hypothetical protein LQ341_006549 [Variospora aurantia]|nr:MAG: hypothetical protein LQ341_006549 [Variospora aurantia]